MTFAGRWDADVASKEKSGKDFGNAGFLNIQQMREVLREMRADAKKAKG